MISHTELVPLFENHNMVGWFPKGPNNVVCYNLKLLKFAHDFHMNKVHSTTVINLLY